MSDPAKDVKYFVKEDDPNKYYDKQPCFFIVDENGTDIWTSVRFGTKEEALNAIQSFIEEQKRERGPMKHELELPHRSLPE